MILLINTGVQRLEEMASHTQVTERNIIDSVWKEVDSVLASVENEVQDVIWTAMNCVVLPRSEMAWDQSLGHQDMGQIV